MEYAVKFWQSNLHGCGQSNSPWPRLNSTAKTISPSITRNQMRWGSLRSPDYTGWKGRIREMNGPTGVLEKAGSKWMDEWHSNEKRRRWRGEGTEGQRIFRVVVEWIHWRTILFLMGLSQCRKKTNQKKFSRSSTVRPLWELTRWSNPLLYQKMNLKPDEGTTKGNHFRGPKPGTEVKIHNHNEIWAGWLGVSVQDPIQTLNYVFIKRTHRVSKDFLGWLVKQLV